MEELQYARMTFKKKKQQILRTSSSSSSNQIYLIQRPQQQTENCRIIIQMTYAVLIASGTYVRFVSRVGNDVDEIAHSYATKQTE